MTDTVPEPPLAATAPPAIPPEGRDPATGRILPGHGGRPRGSKNKRRAATLETQEAIEALGPAAVEQVAVALRRCESWAVKLVLDRVLPAGGRTIELNSSDPNAIIDAAAHGHISPDEAARLAQASKTVADAAELKELKAQVEQLELLITALKR